METRYITLSVRRLETPEERMKREGKEISLRCIAGAVVALCVAAIALGWYAIVVNRAITGESKAVTAEPVQTPKNAESQRMSAFVETDILKTAPDLRMSEHFATDIYDGHKEIAEESGSDFGDDNKIANPSPLTDSEWAVLVETCKTNSIPVEVGLGLIWVESRFDRNAVSPAGCTGLCQLNPRYFPGGLSSEDNIRYGMNYLGSCLSRYGTMEAALTTYNAGYDTGGGGYATAVLQAAEEWRPHEELD